MTDEIKTRGAPVTEQEYLEDNIATVAFHLGQPGAHLKVNHGSTGIDVSPGAVLAEISRRLGLAQSPALEPVAWRARSPDGFCTSWFDGAPPKLHGPYECAYAAPAQSPDTRVREALSSRSEAPVAGEPEPFCWVIPGDDQANGEGWLDARITKWSEFTQPLYRHPPAPKSPALDPATVEALIQRLKLVGVSLAFDLKDESAATVRDAIEAIRVLLASGASNAGTSTVRACATCGGLKRIPHESGGYGVDCPDCVPSELETARSFLREKPSTSYLQRKMQIGYVHAARIIEKLEDEGFISRADSAGRRTILNPVPQTSPVSKPRCALYPECKCHSLNACTYPKPLHHTTSEGER